MHMPVLERKCQGANKNGVYANLFNSSKILQPCPSVRTGVLLYNIDYHQSQRCTYVMILEVSPVTRLSGLKCTIITVKFDVLCTVHLSCESANTTLN